MEYEKFIKSKQKKFVESGFNIDNAEINPVLFDFQRDIVKWAIKKGKAGIFASTGLGKTIVQLEWAKHISNYEKGNILIVAPLAVAQQTAKEGEKINVKVNICRHQSDVQDGINITNYEMLQHFDASKFVGVVLDESSILKSFDGKMRNEIIEKFADTKYKLACTATPSPNDYMELGNHCEFLGVMSYVEMLSTFFVHDGGDTAKWRLKGHAQKDFWNWMASWSVMLKHPKDLGYDAKQFDLPELRIHEVIVDKPCGTAKTLDERRKARQKTVELRTKKSAEIANSLNEQVLVWCDLNIESELLHKNISGSYEIRGSHDNYHKSSTMIGFADGKISKMISKPSISGFGMNFQNCSKMIFTGLSDCYSEDTELLTKRGWLKFSEVTLDDFIASINPITLSFEWQNPSKVVWEHYIGEMIHFDGERNFDLLVTPNHKLFVKSDSGRYHNSDGNWNLEYAIDIKENYKRQFRNMLSAPLDYSGNYIDNVTIPTDTHKKSSRVHIIVPKIQIEIFMKLIGWYLSEGYCRPKESTSFGRIVICQTDKNPENRNEIIELLNSLNLNVNSKTKDITVYSSNLASYLLDNFGDSSYTKRISSWVKDLDRNLLILLRDTMLKGDGCHRNGIPRTYRTVSKQLANDFQEICLKTGVRASIHYRENVGTGIYSNHGCYDVNIAWKNITPYIHNQPKSINYDGMVGCVTVPNHIIIVRRNGIPVVSGNSFEAYYQAVRRCWRFGQTKPVDVYVITSYAEGEVVKNIKRKEGEFNKMLEGMISATQEITSKNIRGTIQMTDELKTDYKSGKGWEMYLGDCVEAIKKIISNKIGYIIFSPPFSSLYVYSNSLFDMGNSSNDNEFINHFEFLVPELYRILQPGRLMSIHCMNLPVTKQFAGYIGIRDFRGDIIRLMEKYGFIYHSEVCIWKDPVTAMQRTKALGLLYKQIKKDSTMCRQGIPDYLVTFRKPGENQDRVSHTEDEFPLDIWQNYASPIWMDINPNETLQRFSVRENEDERHICPLQLQVIKRGIELWTKEGDVVFSPFAGIGSEGYEALKYGRKFIGIELKQSYFDQAVKNLELVAGQETFKPFYDQKVSKQVKFS